MTGKRDKADSERSDAVDPEVADESVDVPDESDSSKPEAVDPEDADKTAEKSASVDAESAEESVSADARRNPSKANSRQVSVSIRTLIVAAVIAALVAAVGVLAWLYVDTNAKLDELARQAADNGRAEQIALDYAVDAAKIDYEDMDAWKESLVKNTTPELKVKLNEAGTSMEQILKPLKWKSTATPLIAKVRSNDNGIYVVNAFVGVETKTSQSPDGVQSTATYSVTVDSTHDWQISEVGGIGSVVGQN